MAQRGHGEEEAVRKLLLFKSDTAGGLFHGVDVTVVIDRIGEAPVARAIAALEPEDRSWVRCLLEVGVAYGTPGGDPADAPRLFRGAGPPPRLDWSIAA